MAETPPCTRCGKPSVYVLTEEWAFCSRACNMAAMVAYRIESSGCDFVSMACKSVMRCYPNEEE